MAKISDKLIIKNIKTTSIYIHICAYILFNLCKESFKFEIYIVKQPKLCDLKEKILNEQIPKKKEFSRR